jgi:hypothetical protein
MVPDDFERLAAKPAISEDGCQRIHPPSENDTVSAT